MAALPEGWKPGGVQGPAPELLPGAQSLWEAWEALSWSRAVGFGVGAIPVSEVLAYCELLQIRSLWQRERLLRTIQRLDAEIMKHHAEQAKQK